MWGHHRSAQRQGTEAIPRPIEEQLAACSAEVVGPQNECALTCTLQHWDGDGAVYARIVDAHGATLVAGTLPADWAARLCDKLQWRAAASPHTADSGDSAGATPATELAA